MTMVTKLPPDGSYGWVIVFANALSNVSIKTAKPIHFIATPIMHCFGLVFHETFLKLKLSATETSFIINLNASFGMITGLVNGVLLKKYGYRKIATIGAFFLTSGMVLTSNSKSFAEFLISYGLITCNMITKKINFSSFLACGMGMCQSAFSLAINLFFAKKRSYAIAFSETLTGFGPILMPQLIHLLTKFYSPSEVALILSGICSHTFIAAVLLQPLKWHTKSVEKSETPNAATNETVTMFDLDLLKNIKFLNIIIGMSLAIFAELNFTILTPFMLHDYELNTSQIATFLSTLGASDIIFRFLAPYIGSYFNKSSRTMYIYSLFCLMITRFTFLFSRNFHFLILVALGLGIAKGIRKVYMSLVIPDFVQTTQLATASGMEMMINGFCVIIGGPLLGMVRDLTGDYKFCVIIMNCITFTTILMWTAEHFLDKIAKNKSIV